jgi:hypothetical protein
MTSPSPRSSPSLSSVSALHARRVGEGTEGGYVGVTPLETTACIVL